MHDQFNVTKTEWRWYAVQTGHFSGRATGRLSAGFASILRSRTCRALPGGKIKMAQLGAWTQSQIALKQAEGR